MSRHEQEQRARRTADDVLVRASRAVIASGADLMNKLESWAGITIKPGRNVLKGYPVDIEDQSPEEGGLAVDAVDRDAATGLLKALRSAGFKTRREGQLGIVIQMSNAPISAAKLSWSNKFTFANAANAKKFKQQVSSASWDGKNTVTVNAQNDAELRAARAIAKTVEPTIKMSNVSASDSLDSLTALAKTLANAMTQLKSLNVSPEFMSGSAPGKKNMIAASRALETAVTELRNAVMSQQ